MFTSLHFASLHFAPLHFTKFGKGLFLFSIDGKSALDYLAPSTLRINRYLNNRSTAVFKLVGVKGYKPNIGEEIFIEYSPCLGQPIKRIFAGHIRDISSGVNICGKTVFHDITAVDYNALLDRRLVINIYSKQNVQDVILAIVRDFLDGEGITTNNVDCKNIFLEKAVFAYIKVSKAFNDIATNTQLYWYIDYYKDLHFFVRSTQTTGAFLSPDCSLNTNNGAPFCANLKVQSCNYGIRSGNISVSRKSDQLVNHQYVIAGKTETDLRVEEFAGDDKRKTFSLKYMVSTPELVFGTTDISPNAVLVNGLPQTIGARDENETPYDWYFTKGERTITQNDDGAYIPLTTGDVLTVSYIGLYDVIKSAKNSTMITLLGNRENTSGLYEDVQDDESIESGDFAQQWADGLVRKFSPLPIEIKFVSDTQVLNVGDVLSVKLDDFGIDMPNGFLVNSIGIQEIAGRLMRFAYGLISGENLGDWQEYFRKIEFFGRQLKLKQQTKLVVFDAKAEGVIIGQTFTASPGITDLEAQDQNYEVAWCHTGRALHYHNFHSIPEVVRLGLT